MQIFKQFTFDSAHYLPNVPEGHKCKEIHGHTYRVVFYFEGELDTHLGWVMDFGDLKLVLEPVIKQIDHKLMNSIAGLENPTCERIAIWLWEQVKPSLPSLCKVELHETPSSGAVYEGK